MTIDIKVGDEIKIALVYNITEAFREAEQFKLLFFTTTHFVRADENEISSLAENLLEDKGKIEIPIGIFFEYEIILSLQFMKLKQRVVCFYNMPEFTIWQMADAFLDNSSMDVPRTNISSFRTVMDKILNSEMGFE